MDVEALTARLAGGGCSLVAAEAGAGGAPPEGVLASLHDQLWRADQQTRDLQRELAAAEATVNRLNKCLKILSDQERAAADACNVERQVGPVPSVGPSLADSHLLEPSS